MTQAAVDQHTMRRPIPPSRTSIMYGRVHHASAGRAGLHVGTASQGRVMFADRGFERDPQEPLAPSRIEVEGEGGVCTRNLRDMWVGVGGGLGQPSSPNSSAISCPAKSRPGTAPRAPFRSTSASSAGSIGLVTGMKILALPVPPAPSSSLRASGSAYGATVPGQGRWE